MAVEGVDAYPLYWPLDWKRETYRSRSAYSTSFVKARDGVLRQLKLMRIAKDDMLISSNIPLRRDGLPLAGMAEPKDPGVAVYWVEREYKGGKYVATPRVMACDHWNAVRDNLHAIELTLDAMRAIRRSGATQVLERAFEGFAALPAQAAAARTWRDVLGLRNSPNVTRAEVDYAYRGQVAVHHPDKGGSHERMVEINRARDEALREVRA